MKYQRKTRYSRRAKRQGSRKINEDYYRRVEEMADDLKLPRNTNGQDHVLLYATGDDEQACSAWYVKVTRNKEGLKMDTNDWWTFYRLLRRQGMTPIEGKRLIEIDDAGIGFPLGGAWCGAYDHGEKAFHVREVPASYFQGKGFLNKVYRKQYAKLAVKMVQDMKADPEKTVVHICPGDVNVMAKRKLRDEGFTVELARIGNPLQDLLEEHVRQCIAEMVGEDVYFDPKDMEPKKIGPKWRYAREVAKKKRLFKLIKHLNK